MSGDSIAQTIGRVNNVLINRPDITTQDITDALLLPFLLLVIFSLVKYFVGVNVHDFDKYGYFTEMPIDVLYIYVSFLIGRFIIVGNLPDVIKKALFILAIIVICYLLTCILRQRVLSCLGTSSFSLWKVIITIVLEFVIAISCLFLIIYIL